jgi:hypothetical protein
MRPGGADGRSWSAELYLRLFSLRSPEARWSGDEMVRNRDFIDDRLDTDRWRASAPLREASRDSVDEQDAAPYAVRLTTIQRSLSACVAHRARAAHGFGSGDVEVIVGEEQMGQCSRAVRAPCSADDRGHEHRWWRIVTDRVVFGELSFGEDHAACWSGQSGAERKVGLMRLRFNQHTVQGTNAALTEHCSESGRSGEVMQKQSKSGAHPGLVAVNRLLRGLDHPSFITRKN